MLAFITTMFDEIKQLVEKFEDTNELSSGTKEEYDNIMNNSRKC